MVRVIARIAAASALAAAVATPLTLSAHADSPPSLPGLGSLTGSSGLPASVTSVLQNLGSLTPIPLAVPGLTPTTTAPTTSSGGTNAPNGSASAHALSIPLLDTCVSCNTANAGNGTSFGGDDALRVLGTEISGGFSKNGGGDFSNSLFALPSNPLLSLALADWDAFTSTTGTTTHGHADSGLVDLALAPAQNVLDLAVLESNTNAQWTPTLSGGDSSSNGVNLSLGNGALVIIVLHSDADSSNGGTSHTYLASINGTQLLNAQQVGQPIVITIPGVVTVTLLQTSSGGGSASAAFVTVTNLLGMNGTQLSGIDASATGGTGTPACTGTGCPGGNPGGNGSSGSSSSGVQAASTPTPSTGVGIGILGALLIGGGLMALGASKAARRWRALA